MIDIQKRGKSMTRITFDQAADDHDEYDVYIYDDMIDDDDVVDNTYETHIGRVKTYRFADPDFVYDETFCRFPTKEAVLREFGKYRNAQQ